MYNSMALAPLAVSGLTDRIGNRVAPVGVFAAMAFPSASTEMVP
jgi:hypothetical protein